MLQSDSASHLWHNFVLASGWEKISVELPPPAHHLLPLTGDQQLVEERAVGEREATILERWLRCRESLKHRTCRIHIVHREKIWLREIIGFVISSSKDSSIIISGKRILNLIITRCPLSFFLWIISSQFHKLLQQVFQVQASFLSIAVPGQIKKGAHRKNRKIKGEKGTNKKITSTGELEVPPCTPDIFGPWDHMQSRWCGRLDTWILVAGLFPGRLGTWGLVPSFQWPPWETWSSCCPFPGILGKWSLLPSLRRLPLELDHPVNIHMYGQSTTALYWLQAAQL